MDVQHISSNIHTPILTENRPDSNDRFYFLLDCWALHNWRRTDPPPQVNDLARVARRVKSDPLEQRVEPDWPIVPLHHAIKPLVIETSNDRLELGMGSTKDLNRPLEGWIRLWSATRRRSSED